jgi:CRP-like cAMP-binding protein
MQSNLLMASFRRTRSSRPDPQDVRMSDLLVDHALTLLLADEPEAALRWGAAALEHDPSTPGALVVTSRLLEQMGRTRAAIEGLRMAVHRAIDAGNVPLAVTAIDDLRTLGVDVSEQLDQVAEAFCQGSARLEEGQAPQLLPEFGDVRPLSPFLAGPSLASKATQILRAAKRQNEEAVDAGRPFVAPVPLFSALPKEALRELLSAFEIVTVPAGHRVIQEGQESGAAYFVARGELEVSRRAVNGDNKPALVLARLGPGAFFGEMALLGQLPGAASVRATRPSILLVARREEFAAIAERHPEAGAELAAHCRRHLVANLGWASPVVAAIPAVERAMLVERLQTRIFEKGDLLVHDGEEAQGLHLIVSGEIAVVGRDRGDRVVLATLTAGETVGEVELVLCRRSNADAIVVRPTATLFLPRHQFYALAQEQPAILHGLYGIAVQRHTETQFALEAGSATVVDEWMLEESTEIMERPALGPAVPQRTEPKADMYTQGALPAGAQLRASKPPEMGRAVLSGAQSFAPRYERRSATAPAVPSYAPTSASLPPIGSAPPERRGSALQIILPAAALVAAAASLVAVIASRDGHQATRGAAANSVPTTTAPATTPATQAISETPAATPRATVSATGATSDKPKAPTTIAPLRARPKAPAAMQASAVPSQASAVASARPPPAASSVATLSSAMPKPLAEAKSPGTVLPPSADDFGGRE